MTTAEPIKAWWLRFLAFEHWVMRKLRQSACNQLLKPSSNIQDEA
jgi:hypothetical protein